jgi:hypothetical protein
MSEVVCAWCGASLDTTERHIRVQDYEPGGLHETEDIAHFHHPDGLPCFHEAADHGWH